MRTISVKLPEDLFVQLTKKARTMRVTKSVLVREGLKEVLGEQPRTSALSCYYLALDLVGIVKGLPRNLARNPEHMEGFGE